MLRGGRKKGRKRNSFPSWILLRCKILKGHTIGSGLGLTTGSIPRRAASASPRLLAADVVASLRHVTASLSWTRLTPSHTGRGGLASPRVACCRRLTSSHLGLDPPCLSLMPIRTRHVPASHEPPCPSFTRTRRAPVSCEPPRPLSHGLAALASAHTPLPVCCCKPTCCVGSPRRARAAVVACRVVSHRRARTRRAVAQLRPASTSA